MNSNNLSIYLDSKAIIVEVEAMRIANVSAIMRGADLPYSEEDYRAKAEELSSLSSYITNE